MAKKINIEKIAQDAQKAADSWLEREDLGLRVERMLDVRLREIVAKMLGFSCRWGGWEVDHWNGQQSEATAYLRDKVSGTVREWLDRQFGELPPLPRGAVSSLKTEYQEKVVCALRDILAEKARERARDIADSIVMKAVGASSATAEVRL